VGGWPFLLNEYYIARPQARQIGKKEGGPLAGRLENFREAYFGAGVVVLPELFFFFVAPFFAWVWVLAGAFVVVAGLSVDAGAPPVAWAIESVAPSNMANAIVSSFFIQSPSVEVSFLKQVKLWGMSDIVRESSAKTKKRPVMRPLGWNNFPESYFGAGVMVSPELFFDFFAPFFAWLCFLVLAVSVLVVSVPPAGGVVLPA
jgi:hypothetical protein